jgi:hypothetical protein
VATSALPGADWRRSFKLGFFVSAAHNLKLLDVMLQVAWRVAEIDLVTLIESLLAGMAAAPPGSVLARIDGELERHASAILNGETMVLPAEGTGDHWWPAEDAIAIAALSDKERFYAELGELVSGALIEEAIRYQCFITPAPGDCAPREAEFEHDFPAFCAGVAFGPESLPRRATALRWSPSPAISQARNRMEFALAYLGAAHARIRTGHVAQGG